MYPSFAHDTMVKVIVGSEKVEFFIHKKYICDISEFFRAACEGKFKEARTAKICLPDWEPATFDDFMEKVYMEVNDFSEYHYPMDENREEERQWWIRLIKLYSLSQYLQVIFVGNAVVDFIKETLYIKTVAPILSRSVISLAYSSTVDGCGLRRLLVAQAVWKCDSIEWGEVAAWKRHFEYMPAEFFHDVSIGLWRRASKIDTDPFVSLEATKVFRDAEVDVQRQGDGPAQN